VRERGFLGSPGTSSYCPYSPECVEGEFYELRLYGFLGSPCSPGPTPMGVPLSDRGYLLCLFACVLRAFSRREIEGAPPFLNRPPLERRLWHEVPALGQCDHRNDDPQHGGIQLPHKGTDYRIGQPEGQGELS
jgi:hypothetical protein